MSIRCALGVHRRLPFEDPNRFVYHRYECARCRGRWDLVIVGEGYGWVRLR